MASKITEDNTTVRPHKYLGYEVVWQGPTKELTAWRRTEDEAEALRQELIKTQGKLPKKEVIGDDPGKLNTDTTG